MEMVFFAPLSCALRLAVDRLLQRCVYNPSRQLGGNRHLLALLEVCADWGCLHVHLGLSSRPELISVEGVRGAEGRRVRSGWLATCPDDICRFMCVWLFCWAGSMFVCWLGLERFNRKLKCHKEFFISRSWVTHCNGQSHRRLTAVL